MCLFIPISLNFEVECGVSPAVSAMQLLLGYIIGVILGLQLIPESAYDMTWIRPLMVACQFSAFVIMAAWSFVFQAAPFWSMPAKTALWWVHNLVVLQIVYLVYSFGDGPFLMLQARLCPREDTTFWTTWQQIGRTIAMIIGPGLFSLLQFSIGAVNLNLDAIGNMAWVNLCMAWCFLACTLTVSFTT